MPSEDDATFGKPNVSRVYVEVLLQKSFVRRPKSSSAQDLRGEPSSASEVAAPQFFLVFVEEAILIECSFDYCRGPVTPRLAIKNTDDGQIASHAKQLRLTQEGLERVQVIGYCNGQSHTFLGV